MQALGAASAACLALGGGLAFKGIIYKGLFRIGFSTGLEDVKIVLVEGCNCFFRNEGVLFRGWDRSESYQSCCRVGAARMPQLAKDTRLVLQEADEDDLGCL